MEIIRSGLSVGHVQSLIKEFASAGFVVEERMGSHGVTHVYRDGPKPLAYISGGYVGLISERYGSEIREIAGCI